VFTLSSLVDIKHLKVNLTCYTPWKAPEGGERSASRPGRALPLGEEGPAPIVQEAAVQSVASHYTD
jgi:hypothetical protein